MNLDLSFKPSTKINLSVKCKTMKSLGKKKTENLQDLGQGLDLTPKAQTVQ